ncbi:ribonuclease HI [Alkalimarinus coralli]|uniref:ribonuclease HI n=1 Tax=Alkalimarinus coralli TaxID=2935863 RepID=UPI00202B7292|nr:ribonuclease HI [Alkalimarinus coralli]
MGLQRDKVIIYTDGACKGNPGPGGWGAALKSGQHKKHIYGGEPNTTNNRMELMAAIKSLQLLNRPCDVDIYTDSQYVRKGITTWIHGWKKNDWRTSSKTPVKNDDLWKALDAEVQRHKLNWHWVKGHSGHPGNEMADALANKGVNAVLKSN